MSLWIPRSTTILIARSITRSPLTIKRSQLSNRLLNSAKPIIIIRHQSSNSSNSTTTSTTPSPDSKASTPAEPKLPLSTRVWKKVKHEAQHYWHGSKLLVSEVRISSGLQWKILQGSTLTRRERRQVSLGPENHFIFF